MSLSKVCGAAVAAAAFAVFAGAAAADPAVVFNIGEGRLHSSCAGGVSGSQYEGFVATAVFNGDHMLLQCTARLVSGPGVDETIVGHSGGCTFVTNPGDLFIFTCNIQAP